uniref:ABC transporter domain-containing protein n=1 Tax=Nelumbo nucifera TaxID=4432 RepID=A0A822YV59_NELNU|nr:TPA_asm: hypothetical protein HUJ06_006101 [Nelumbo nucifera]
MASLYRMRRIKNLAVGRKLRLYLLCHISEVPGCQYKVLMNKRRSSDAEKYIHYGITGSVQLEEVLALMGPSGGGKTT